MFRFNLSITQILLVIVVAFILLKSNNKEHFTIDRYKNIKSGKLNDVSNKYELTSEDQCKKWAKTMNKQFKSNPIHCVRKSEDCPKFCFVENGKVFWTNSNSGQCSQQQQCIFRKKD